MYNYNHYAGLNIRLHTKYEVRILLDVLDANVYFIHFANKPYSTQTINIR